MTEYNIGDIFNKPCPTDVADWCNNNNAYIDDYEDDKVIIRAIPEETPAERKAFFLEKFFKVNLGEQEVYYRKKPKGYQSAVESINTAQIICSKLNGLPENTLIFYQEPNFKKAEQCTEEWLVEHQIVLPAMTSAQFDELYISFIQAWNAQEH